jgi:hypothetical protein
LIKHLRLLWGNAYQNGEVGIKEKKGAYKFRDFFRENFRRVNNPIGMLKQLLEKAIRAITT